MFNVFAVHPDRVAQTASWIPQIIAKACSRSGNPFDLLLQCTMQQAVLWIIADENAPAGIAITRIGDRQGERVVDIIVAGGERGLAWTPALRKRMHEYRKAEGAACLLAAGRKGWGRVLGMTPYGYADGAWLFEDYG